MSVDPLIVAVTPKTDWYVVLRPFDGDRRFARGEVVNTDGWVHRQRLVENRYIAPLPHGAKLPEAGVDGIRLLSLDAEQEMMVPSKKRPVPTRKTDAA